MRLQSVYGNYFKMLGSIKIEVRGSRSQMFFFFKKDVLQSFANLTGKHLQWSLFSIKLQAFRPEKLLKREPNTVLSYEIYEIYEIFKDTLFYRTHPVAASERFVGLQWINWFLHFSFTEAIMKIWLIALILKILYGF